MPEDPHSLPVVEVANGVAEGGDQPSEREEDRERRQQPLKAGLRKDPQSVTFMGDA